MKRYIVQRSNKAEIRPKEQSEKVDSCRETLSNEIQLKGPYRQKQTRKKKKKRVGTLGWFMWKARGLRLREERTLTMPSMAMSPPQQIPVNTD